MLKKRHRIVHHFIDPQPFKVPNLHVKDGYRKDQLPNLSDYDRIIYPNGPKKPVPWEQILPANLDKKIQTIIESGNGCFAPGTMVWTDTGEIPIETLREHDRILTRAISGKYGLKSDEVVALPVEGGKVVLYGFNGQRPFFTRNHVFHTTTGLRAVDLIAVKMENLWLEVGKLRCGNTLLYTSDGRFCEHFTIWSLLNIVEECDHV
ncbi:hypothetical protein M501DRAFT_772501 [Patellaria atrata CBS 101060]|uniref:Hint domain-containing protein n=1 Tax=Patellaria atrata CBS 101060 TaxID=1346257 RepID=A0A9P4SAU1_9PEZI|nr:hypothetical protein M501DRAFT_772501 [Patellaria atrata CBS 101060]